MITPERVAEIQQQLGQLSIMAAQLDLDAFIEVTEQVGSPQALAAGIDPRAVASAPKWNEMARLLKPFRDHAVERLDRIRAQRELPHYGPDDDEVRLEFACPGCGERRVDELKLADDDSAQCLSCGRRYQLPELEDGAE